MADPAGSPESEVSGPRRRPEVAVRVTQVLGGFTLFALLETYFFFEELINRSDYDHGQSGYTAPTLHFVAALLAAATLTVLAILIFRGNTKDAKQIFRAVVIAVAACVLFAIAALFARPEYPTFLLAAFLVGGLLIAWRDEPIRDWCSW